MSARRHSFRFETGLNPISGELCQLVKCNYCNELTMDCHCHDLKKEKLK